MFQHLCRNLANIGRNLDKTIIIDNLPENFKLQPNNGIGIKTWIDDINDTQLIEIKRILKGKGVFIRLEIINYKVGDVRNVIKKINEEWDKLSSKNQNNPFAEISVPAII